jgi:hypothetical protein
MGTVALGAACKAGSRLETDEPSRLVGAMTRAAKEVNALLKKVDLPPRVTRFLRHLEDLTFGNAGYHQHWGHTAPGSWCHFDLAAWARELELEKSSLLRIRRRLVEVGIIWFEAEESQPGRGRIGWNLVYSEWLPLQGQGRRWGGSRPGAGHPSQQANIDILKAPGTRPAIQGQRQASIDILNTDNRPGIDILKGSHQASIDILNQRAFRQATPETAREQASGALKKSNEEEKSTEERTEGAPARLARDRPGIPLMPSSGPPGQSTEDVLEILHQSAGWKADRGKDLLLLKSLQHYPLEWLYERAADYAFADGSHSYQGFKSWCQSPRAQEKLRLWEQARRARATRNTGAPPVQLLSRQAQEEEEARIVAERNARSRARFGRQAPQDEKGW